MPGIYVHVPFCKSKCAYCDFASYPKEFSKCDLYFACLYKEIKGRSESLKDYVFDTVYFGGGTPSYVDPKYVIGAMRQIRNYYKIADNAEITIEMNPGTVDENKIKQYEKAGFNRFSVGLQTANDDLLRDIGRIHTKADFVKTAELLKGKNFSVDIMIGLEGQTTEDIKEAIDLASSAGAKHISSYALKAEEGTPMYGRYLNGDLPSEDEVADEYDFTVKYLAEKGYKRYEVLQRRILFPPQFKLLEAGRIHRFRRFGILVHKRKAVHEHRKNRRIHRVHNPRQSCGNFQRRYRRRRTRIRIHHARVKNGGRDFLCRFQKPIRH